MTADELIAKWTRSGGNERANTQLFVTDLCALLGVEAPQPTLSDTSANDYVFERHVVKTEIDGTTSNGWIDCYKRDSFILEAKQGSAADIAAVEGGEGAARRDFFGQTAAERFKRGMAKRGTGQWTGAMQRAAAQAEGYAKNLPADHGWPPILLVSDIGHCIDVYADFQRNGKGYAPFPDRRRYRIAIEDLRDPDVRARLAAIWTAPTSLDPSVEATRVTREIAGHLAVLAKDIEAREQNADRVAAFLMRLLFTMFAEDTGLIEKDSFSDMLRRLRDHPDKLPLQLTALWQAMDTGGFVGALGQAGVTLRRFNGYLFKDSTAIALTTAEIDVLIAAAKADWRQVEPAIFGTLLERALDTKERAKLGAHYTPRAYVERLVGPTIMEPLRADWDGARTAATIAAEKGDRDAARRIIETFHLKLAGTRVLDPACGTGNFLYVAMARMKELEGEVLELLDALGDERYLAELSSHTITPENFLGIEINPRAAQIAQLVLWIGYLQWHFRVNGENRMPEAPVLRDVRTIECRDALIDCDGREVERDARARPVTRWDGETMKPHPVTGKPVPDERAQVEVWRYLRPKQAKWPKADFIIGNPPFIGTRRMRLTLGDGYVETLFSLSPDVPEVADYVMYWWDRAAALVVTGHARRAGLITTNSLTQAFNREIVSRRLTAQNPVSIGFAIADHPWVENADGAAVRIAMTMIIPGRAAGQLFKLASSGQVETLAAVGEGSIAADLRIGASPAEARVLKANRNIAFWGVKFYGDGFVPSADVNVEPALIRPFISGQDLVHRPRGLTVIDCDGLDEAELRLNYPCAYAHLLTHVQPVRAHNPRAFKRERWWIFGENQPGMRAATRSLDRYIVTTETAKHRIFQFVDHTVLTEGTVATIALSDAWHLGVLSSRAHVCWALAAGGMLGPTPRYNKTRCFDPFPFPDRDDGRLGAQIIRAAESLDALRKTVLARHADLTLTGLYNVLGALRAAEAEGMVLSTKDRDIAERGCVSLIRQYHDAIDAGVAEAYGWPADLADEEILERLVALNKERAAEEAKGKVRWLRPAYQAPAHITPKQEPMPLAVVERPSAQVIEWPGALPDQVVAVAGVVARAGRPVAGSDVARAFRAKRAGTVLPVLDALAGMGRVRKLEDGRYAA